MKLHVSLKQKHIDAGETLDCKKCPGALAILEAYGPQATDIEVDSVSVYLMTRDRGAIQTALIPDVFATFIKAFDSGIPVTPIEFDLDFDPEC